MTARRLSIKKNLTLGEREPVDWFTDSEQNVFVRRDLFEAYRNYWGVGRTVEGQTQVLQSYDGMYTTKYEDYQQVYFVTSELKKALSLHNRAAMQRLYKKFPFLQAML